MTTIPESVRRTKGPRIRHPTGSVYLDIIYKKDRHSDKLSPVASLYQSILEYGLSKERPRKKGVKLFQIANWILDHNQYYIDFYSSGSDSHIKRRDRLDGVLDTIRRYIKNLEELQLIIKLGFVEANTKNQQMTPLYEYTELGYIIAWILLYDHNPDKREIAKLRIFNLIRHILGLYNSYMADYLFVIFKKMMKYDNETHNGFFDLFILNLINLLCTNQYQSHNSVQYLSKALDIMFKQKKTSRICQSLYIKALEEFPDRIRNIILYHEKAFSESFFVLSQPPKDWDELWIDNIGNYSTLVLYGVCQNQKCAKKYATTINYYEYRKGNLIADCKLCRSKGSLRIYDSLQKIKF